LPDIEPRLSDLNCRIAICTMHDVVSDKGVMTLTREPVATVWAKVYALPHLPSFISSDGYAIMERQDRVTHWITLRYKTDLDFTSAAWLYETRRKSPPRWYKVLGFYDGDLWIVLHCHLVEKSVNATEPRNPLSAQLTEI
jgi:head-tail adaptor